MSEQTPEPSQAPRPSTEPAPEAAPDTSWVHTVEIKRAKAPDRSDSRLDE